MGTNQWILAYSEGGATIITTATFSSPQKEDLTPTGSRSLAPLPQTLKTTSVRLCLQVCLFGTLHRRGTSHDVTAVTGLLEALGSVAFQGSPTRGEYLHFTSLRGCSERCHSEHSWSICVDAVFGVLGIHTGANR